MVSLSFTLSINSRTIKLSKTASSLSRVVSSSFKSFVAQSVSYLHFISIIDCFSSSAMTSSVCLEVANCCNSLVIWAISVFIREISVMRLSFSASNFVTNFEVVPSSSCCKAIDSFIVTMVNSELSALKVIFDNLSSAICRDPETVSNIAFMRCISNWFSDRISSFILRRLQSSLTSSLASRSWFSMRDSCDASSFNLAVKSCTFCSINFFSSMNEVRSSSDVDW